MSSADFEGRVPSEVTRPGCEAELEPSAACLAEAFGVGGRACYSALRL